MKRLGQILAALAVAFLVLAVISGIRTDPQGRLTAQSFWQGFRNLGGWFSSTFGDLPLGGIAGNVAVAVAIGAVLALVVLALLPRPVSGKAFTMTVVVAAALALVLYQPSLVGA